MTDECGGTVHWWEGEYDGECKLPAGHLEPFHFDGISYYDDDNNNRNYEQENLDKLISKAVREAKGAEKRRLTYLKIDKKLIESEAQKIEFTFKETACGVEHYCVFASDGKSFSVAVNGQNIVSRQLKEGVQE